MRLFWRKALELYVFITILFLLHRAFSFFYLQGYDEWSISQILFALLGGVASDIWIAALLSVAYLVIGSIVWLLTSSIRILPWLAAFFMVLLGTLTIFHQPYVQYFGYQIIPPHLNYLANVAFLTDKAPYLLNFWALILLLATAIFAWDLRHSKRRPIIREEAGVIPLVSLYTIALLIAIGCHSLNTHYRGHFVIPKGVGNNYIENLYLSWR